MVVSKKILQHLPDDMRIKPKDMKLLTRIGIAVKMMGIFQNHIGRDSSISHKQLFRAVFGRKETESLADELRWEYCKKAMHMLRQRTKCFIGSRFHRNSWHYFVVKDDMDAMCYIKNLDKCIARMKAMQKKVIKAVEEKWYELDWTETKAIPQK